MSFGSRVEAEQVSIEEVIKQWEILEAAGSHLEGSFTLRHPRSSKGDQPLPQNGKFFVDGGAAWISATTYTTKLPQYESVIGKNEHYAFKLSRLSQDAPYVLTFLGKPDADFDTRLFQAMNDNYGCTVPWNVLFKPLTVWVKERGFSVLGLHRTDQGGKKILFMDCEYRSPNGDRRNSYLNIRARLDPDNHYRVDSYEADIWSGKAFAKVDYGPNDGDLPVPVRNTITFTIRKDGDRRADWVCDYHEWKYRKKPAPEEAVGLSTFELPEPMGTKPPKQSHAWFWLLIALAGSVMLAILFGWLKRRQRTAFAVNTSLPHGLKSP